MSIRKGNIIIAGSGGGTGGGIANVDNATIITNADGSISTIAIKDQNNTENVKFWTGTLAEYEALQEYDENTLYNVTDDDESVEGLGQEIEAFAGQVQELQEEVNEVKANVKVATAEKVGLVKPDGTTITIAEDGTISAEVPEIDTSKLATKEELNAKQDAGDYALKSDIPDVSNLASKDEIPAPYELPIASTDILGGVKVDGETIKITNGVISAESSGGDGVVSVVEAYVNGTEGYNLYSNGYCEQWGKVTTTGSNIDYRATITLLKPYKDANYNILGFGVTTATDAGGSVYSQSASSFVLAGGLKVNGTVMGGTALFWKTCGYIA